MYNVAPSKAVGIHVLVVNGSTHGSRGNSRSPAAASVRDSVPQGPDPRRESMPRHDVSQIEASVST